ncbi:hypothetical protein AJ80_06695 [Polytolypa hystricis UAMH7299]|uniref:Uncharacterized protein n=1 Tax=Polytolypa hystricis (strain UAMH7299) TaxID=1447883 RepID=A0A2B7XLB4_POLH7|nr:hypothetical protein AJ80_06695 [Polytolypa hystricis UAMH7299]
MQLLHSFLFNVIIPIHTIRKGRSGYFTIKLISDSVICALLIPAITLSVIKATFHLWKATVVSPSGLIICDEDNTYSPDCFPGVYQIGCMELAGVILGCLIWILHFSLFIYSCRAKRTQTRRQARAHRNHSQMKERGEGEEEEKEEGRIYVNLNNGQSSQEFFTPYDGNVSQVSIPQRAVTSTSRWS